MRPPLNELHEKSYEHMDDAGHTRMLLFDKAGVKPIELTYETVRKNRKT